MVLSLFIDSVSSEIELLIVTEIIKAENDKRINISFKDGVKRNACLYDNDELLAEGCNEINRYLARTINTDLYGGISANERTAIDHWMLFAIEKLTNVSKIKENLSHLDCVLLTCTWLVNKRLTLADIHIFSALLNQQYMKHYGNDFGNITRWYKHMESLCFVKNSLSVIENSRSNSRAKDIIPENEKVTAKQTKTKKQEGKFVDLPGAEMGKVVVRFPPEASGYLHIGHAKAALLNQYYAETFKGTFIMRFDDTNPEKETVEFEKAILQDLKLLQIKSDKFTHTSDYFEILEEYCTTLIERELAYVDNTPACIMMEERSKKLQSQNRNNSVDTNLSLWNQMRCGTEKGLQCCVRAKIDYQSTNGCLRDPTIYRCKLEPHPRTGTKYKVYPTYDFACPIVDAIENVTHTLRTTEYHDREAQFYWIINALGLRCPIIWEYSRLNMTYTVLSKRKLTWFVNEGLVDGWNDPRMPTVRGILRRGMTVEGLKQFIIAQGSSKSVVFMEWDKIWAFNKKVIDPVAVRYTALDYDKVVTVHVINAVEEWLDVQNHPKDPSLGTKRVRISPEILIHIDDARKLVRGENATFINWGNLMIEKIHYMADGNICHVTARLNLTDKNYKNTLKITWIAAPLRNSSVKSEEVTQLNPVKCYAVYFNHIMDVAVLGKDDNFKDFVAKDTRKEFKMWGETEMKRVKKGEIIQLQRKGFFICDVPYAPTSPYSLREQPVILFHIPDGRATTPSITPAVSRNQQKDTVQHKIAVEKTENKKAGKLEEQNVNKTEKLLFDTIQYQEDKMRQLKSTYKEITGQDWELTQVTTTDIDAKRKEILEQLNKQFITIQNLNFQIDKSIIEEQMKVLLNLINDYQNAIQEKKLTEITGADLVSNTKTKEMSTKMQNYLRVLQNIVDRETKNLSNLKEEYKIVTGHDWKSSQNEAADIVTDNITSKEKELSEKIEKKYYDIVRLVDSNTDIVLIDQEIRIYENMKAEYKNLTGQMWYPLELRPTTSSDTTNKKTVKEVELSKQIIIEDQYLKQIRADKGTIGDQEEIVSNLKTKHKNITGQDWKRPESAATVSDTIDKNIIKEISENIKKQGDVVRNLKSSKADKSIIDQEVKILLNLKAEYKNVTGQVWKPPAITSVTSSDTTNKETVKEIELFEKIRIQEDQVQNLKKCKADKKVIAAQVEILSNMKTKYKNATGQDWKRPEFVATVSDTVDEKSIKEISENIKKQGDVVRNLKSSKADKSLIDKEVKILLKLKLEYTNATGQKWKPVSNLEVASKNKKEDAPKSGKILQKEIAKSVTSKDTDTGKTGTRLGLEVKKEENFFDWYSQVITKSGMIEYYDVSGCYILRPWSFAIWKIIKDYIDKEITVLGVEETYFPIFVTRGVLEKEKTHIADFAPEVAWVTKCGESDLAEPIAIRPTSETVMYPAYAKWLRSDTDLPLRLNQWNNVVRWEFKDPKPFLRTREFLWQEGHTAFATKAEAEEEVLIILDMYARVYEDLLAVPVIKGRKTEKEKFAGGDYTTTVEAYISTSGRAVQGATSHHLGQNFSKMFSIQMEGIAEGDEKTFVYQNSWGLTTRTIGVMIMVHGDDKGLVLPPQVAAIQGIVIPCGITASMSAIEKETLQAECVKLVEELSRNGKFKVKGDFRNNRTPGWKFNHWELKGVPVRIELGPKDLQKNQVTFVRRDTFQKTTVKRDTVATSLDCLLKNIQAQLLCRARENLFAHVKQVENWNDFGTELNKKNLLLSPFCGEVTCEDNIKADSAREDSNDEPGALSMGAKSLCIPFEQPKLEKPLDELKCIHYSCKNKAKFYTLFGRSY